MSRISGDRAISETASRKLVTPLSGSLSTAQIRHTLSLLLAGQFANGSVTGNTLLAEFLYLAEYIERMGTGTLDMIRRCVEANLPEPQFAVTDGFVATVRGESLAGQAGVQAVLSDKEAVITFLKPGSAKA